MITGFNWPVIIPSSQIMQKINNYIIQIYIYFYKYFNYINITDLQN